MTIIANQRRFSNGISYQVTQSKTLKFHLYFNLCWSPTFLWNTFRQLVLKFGFYIEMNAKKVKLLSHNKNGED